MQTLSFGEKKSDVKHYIRSVWYSRS